MQNIEMKVDGTKLTIVVDLTKPGTPSSTGKTKLIGRARSRRARGGCVEHLDFHATDDCAFLHDTAPIGEQ